MTTILHLSNGKELGVTAPLRLVEQAIGEGGCATFTMAADGPLVAVNLAQVTHAIEFPDHG